MRNQGQLFIGLFLILAGGLFLISNLLGINFWTYCWPVGLILLGVWLLLRPQMVGSETQVVQRFVGNVERDGVWRVRNEEIWSFIGDIEMDLTQADIPAGETTIRVYSFIGDVKLYLPADVGVAVTCNAFINDVRVLDEKQEGFLNAVQISSHDYQEAERSIRLEATCFVGDVKVRRIGAPTIDALKAAEKGG